MFDRLEKPQPGLAPLALGLLVQAGLGPAVQQNPLAEDHLAALELRPLLVVQMFQMLLLLMQLQAQAQPLTGCQLTRLQQSLFVHLLGLTENFRMLI
jgi:hypothetical protein